jgi:hypothetical protein
MLIILPRSAKVEPEPVIPMAVLGVMQCFEKTLGEGLDLEATEKMVVLTLQERLDSRLLRGMAMRNDCGIAFGELETRWGGSERIFVAIT